MIAMTSLIDSACVCDDFSKVAHGVDDNGSGDVNYDVAIIMQSELITMATSLV